MDHYPVISILRENQSTITLDSNNFSQDTPPATSTTLQSQNVSRTRGLITDGKVNSLLGIQRSQNQFGYWYNDELSFHPGNSLLYVRMLIQRTNSVSERVAFTFVCKIPENVLNIYQCADEANDFFNSNDAEAIRNVQHSFVQQLVFIMNNYAQDMQSATTNTNNLTAGGYLNDPTYVDARGNTGATSMYTRYIQPGNIRFVASDTATTVEQIKVVSDNVLWDPYFFFVDGECSIYNTISGSLSSGLGYRRSSFIRSGPFGATPTLVTSQNFLYTANDCNTLFYIGGPGNDTSVSDFNHQYALDYEDDITFVNFATRLGTLQAYSSSSGKQYIIPRATSLSPSKYYTIKSIEMNTDARTDTVSNNQEMGKDVVGYLPATNQNRNTWAEYNETSPSKFLFLQTNVPHMTVDYYVQDDSNQVLYAKRSNRNFNGGNIYMSYTTGQLPILDPIPLRYYGRKYTDSGARVNAGSTFVNFATAKTTS